MQIHLDNTKSAGMGDNLCFLSLLCSLKEPVELLVSNKYGTYDNFVTFKRVLNVPDEKVTVIESSSDTGPYKHYGWPSKLFSKYWQPVNVYPNGNKYRTDGRGDQRVKGYIGIVSYNGSLSFVDDDGRAFEWGKTSNGKWEKAEVRCENTWPHCRYRPVSYWSKVFEYCKSNKYDVMNLDNGFTGFDDKVELMMKYCKAIIGYEGGIAHLAHILRIPYFMVDWKPNSPSTLYGEYHTELVHLSNYMYMLKDDELFSWPGQQLEDMIDSVAHANGNNRFTNGNHKLVFADGKINGTLLIKNQNDEVVWQAPGIFGDDALAKLLIEQFF